MLSLTETLGQEYSRGLGQRSLRTPPLLLVGKALGSEIWRVMRRPGVRGKF